MKKVLPLIVASVLLASATAEASFDPVADKCVAGKTITAGKYALCLADAASKLAATGDGALYDALIAKCELKLAKPWSRYEAAAVVGGSACPSEGDQQSVKDYVDACMSAVADACNGAGLPDLASELAACQSAADACGTNLSTCTAGSDSCTASLTTKATELVACEASLGTSNASLTTCTASLSTCTTSLGSCSNTATACSGGTAVFGDVLTGKTFSSTVGLGQIGTMANNGAVTLTPGTTDQAIAAGYHNGSGKVVGDADLVAANIKQGADVFGVVGTSIEASGSAAAGQVLSGATFSNAGGASTGSMPNNGAVTLTPGTADQAIAAGYHNGSGKVVGDPDLVAGNINQGADVFGVVGTSIEASGSAAAGQVLSGATFSNAGGASTGSMPNNGAVTLTPGTADQAIAAGYHNGSGKVVGDADLVAGNIKQGVQVFGVAGTIDVAGYEDAIASCSASLASCSESLGACGVNLSTTNADLGSCNGSLGTCNAGLSTANAALSATNSDLASCNNALAACESSACGNGVLEAGEDCEVDWALGTTFDTGSSCAGEGFDAGTLACGAGCVYDTSGCRNQVCGDGFVDAPEECDDGNAVDGDGCDSGCLNELFCGDGLVTGGEACDGLNLDGQTCQSSGFSYGTLACTACALDTSGCTDRFLDNGNGTITDYQTNLVWEKKSDNGDIHDKDNSYTWASSPYTPSGTAYTVFLPTLNNGKFAGHNDWRLPTIGELETLIASPGPPYTHSIFKAGAVTGCNATSVSCSWTRSDNYWSSTAGSYDPNWASYVNFNNGIKATIYYAEAYSFAVRAVRTGS